MPDKIIDSLIFHKQNPISDPIYIKGRKFVDITAYHFSTYQKESIMDFISDLKPKKSMWKIKVKVIIEYVVLCCVILNINPKKSM